MNRILVLVITVMVFIWLLKRALGSRKKDTPPADNVAVPDLVECAHCHVLLPKADAVIKEEAEQEISVDQQPPTSKYYCCEEHRKLGSG